MNKKLEYILTNFRALRTIDPRCRMQLAILDIKDHFNKDKTLDSKRLAYISETYKLLKKHLG